MLCYAYITTINDRLNALQECCNLHPLSLEGNVSPIHLHLVRSLRQQVTINIIDSDTL